MRRALVLFLLFVLSLADCRRTALIGSLLCQLDSDCSPPDTICGPDGRCIPGCVRLPSSCFGGSVCDPQTGECEGVIGTPCTSDAACDAPALVCRPSTQTCVAGCTLVDDCAAGFVCNPQTGHCCDPTQGSCPPPVDMGGACNTDSECIGAPANICSGGRCVPGCGASGCVAPLVCSASSGHCQLPSCATDADCDSGSYCSPAASCTVLSFGGPSGCAGGTAVPYACAVKTTPDSFLACTGPAGPGGCPFCLGGSCFHPGVCASANDCHRGDQCSGRLCIAQAPQCPVVVSLADVVSGKFAAGKELCVSGKVSSARTGYDGMIEIRLNTDPYLYVDISPLYQAAGVRVPPVGQTVTVHGTVRWDAAHNDRELLPVDWVSP